MSKERARRRAEREAERERLAAERARREARAARRRELRARFTAVLPKPVRVARQGGYLARRRRVQNAVVAVAWFLIQAVAWILLDTWMARLAVFGVSILLIPVLVTVFFDRRS
ncbi:hypothetical protein Aph01nite_47070 [Acrocarpospora phusangensis]|uniref:Uncharacterized protein n=1 Tax=Acrocarpospora phusangensis TaxID=1070424 RepID=A0A919QHN3_9ACTN|nr:hypothetical protein [Acrocarpospora phusangensis]GIH26397.1 hypothetical protein Aph01nite_47070 [Acrocarpospora phusangensis]